MDISSTVLKLPEITSSYLSPYVKNLICIECFSERTESRVLDENGFLNFDVLTESFPESDGPKSDSREYFTECTRILGPMLTSVEEWMTWKGESYVCENLSHWTSWTNQQKMMTELYAMMFSNNDVNDIAILLATTAILERALGDVYLLNGALPCPSMLKDLLVSKPLIDVLGNNVIQVLRVLIGPPISLNIRNVVWHGFPIPGEIPRRCIWFMLLLVPSIGHVLHSKGVAVIQHREPVVFPEVTLIQEYFILPDDMLQFASSSKFTGWDTTVFWKSLNKLYKEGKYSLCAALLCYYLEQGLRRIFVIVNRCEHRIITAESSALFTTFDEILSFYLPDITENRLINTLGESTMEVLLDHLKYQDGPRVRDRLSHGEADWFSFPKPLTDNLIALCISLAVRFSSTQPCDKGGAINDLLASFKEYNVQFHRISLIKKSLSKLYQQINEFDSIIVTNTDLNDRSFEDDSLNNTCTTEDHAHFEESVKAVCNEIVSHWKHDENQQDQTYIVESMSYCLNTKCNSVMENILRYRIRTLYRESKSRDAAEVICNVEGEVLNILDHVMSECLTTIVNMCNFACLRQQQLKDKQLRSRQRENFKKFLSSFPPYIVAVKLYGYMVTWQLYHLDHLNSSKNVGHITRLWKNILQCCENLRTFTHEEKNKWTDGVELLKKHISSLVSTIHRLFVKL